MHACASELMGVLQTSAQGFLMTQAQTDTYVKVHTCAPIVAIGNSTSAASQIPACVHSGILGIVPSCSTCKQTNKVVTSIATEDQVAQVTSVCRVDGDRKLI